MNSRLFRLAFAWQASFVVVCFAALCSCVSASPPKIFTYDLNRKIYPAVWEYFAQKQESIKTIDPDNDEVATDFILEYSTSSIRHYRYRMTVKGESGVISSTIERQYQEGYSTWKSTSAYSREAEAALEAISKLVQSPDYEQKRQNLNKDLLFHFLVLKDLTQLGQERWFNEHIKGTEFDLDLSLGSANKNTSSKSGKKYVLGFYFAAEVLYAPTLSQSTREIASNTIIGPITTAVPETIVTGSFPYKSSGFSIDYYTDDERIATMRPGTRVRVRAKLIDNSILTTRKAVGGTIIDGTIYDLALE